MSKYFLVQIKSLLAEVEAEKAKTKKEEVLERMRQAAVS